MTAQIEQRFAGFWIRFFACIIDALILAVPSALLQILLFPVNDGVEVSETQTAEQALILLINIAYYVYFVGSKWQATPGKRLLGIYIIKADGQPISYLRALGRYFAYIPSALIFLIGYFMIGFTKEKTGLHDLIASTRVIYGKPS